jgi:hypothetical protein
LAGLGPGKTKSRIGTHQTLAFHFGSDTNVGFQPLRADNIDWPLKQLGNVIFERNAFIDADPGGRIDLDQNIKTPCRGDCRRAREPNKAAWLTPRARRAFSFARSLARIS